DLDRTIAAVAPERPAREIGRSRPNTLVYRRVDRDRHRRSPARSIVRDVRPGRAAWSFRRERSKRAPFRKPLEPPEGRVISHGPRHSVERARLELEGDEGLVGNVVFAAQPEPRRRLETDA